MLKRQASWVLAAAVMGCAHAGTALPSGVREVHDVPYTSPVDAERKHQLNVFIPSGRGPHPTIVFVHGGAWFFGDRDTRRRTYDNLGRHLADQGFLTVVPSYRLAPQHQHPAHVEDVAAAIAWTIAHAHEHGGDRERLFVMGHSAGAHLITLVATDPRWLAAHGTSPTILRGVIGMSGPYDLTQVRDEGFFAGRIIERAFGSDPAVHRDASPMTHIGDNATLPPFLLIVAEGDNDSLQEQAVNFGAALETRGVRVERFVAEDRTHFTEVTEFGKPGDAVAPEVERFTRAQAP